MTRTGELSRRRLAILLAMAMLATMLPVVFAGTADARNHDNGVDFTLAVLHNNDGESDLLGDDDGAGSIARFGDLLRDQRKDLRKGKDRGAIAITAGDNFLASPEFQASLDKGVPYFDSTALSRIGYDAFVIGNHEFDFGPTVLANFISGIRTCHNNPFLSANLVFDAEPALAALEDSGCIQDSIVLKEKGEKIGVIGLTTPDLREVSSPGAVEILTDLAGIANAEAQALTDQGVDKIIVASHLQSIDNEVELASQLSNVDAVIGGGGGETLTEALTATTADGITIPIVTVPGDYFDLGRLIIEFNAEGETVGFDWDLLPVTGDLDEDKFLAKKVEEPVQDFVDVLDETVVANSEVPLNGVRTEVRTRETNVGNLLSDAHVATVEARAAEFGVTLGGPIIGLQNGGGIRNDSVIPAGPITLLDTFDIAPFTNFVSVLVDVAASDVIAAVEHGLDGLPDAAGSFAQWSGLTVTFDASQPVGSRIVDLTINGTPYVIGGAVQGGLAPVDIATIDFLAAGNDGYDMFETYTFTRVGTSYQQALADQIASADLTAGSVEYAPRGTGPGEVPPTRVIPQP